MKLREFRALLGQSEALHFLLPNGSALPAHFHISEVGLLTRHFVDCGKSVHTEWHAVFQVWTADDLDHRLAPQTLARVIDKADPIFGDRDPDVLVEVQLETIGTFGLDHQDGCFRLVPLQTDCRAKTSCDVAPIASARPALPVAPTSCC